MFLLVTTRLAKSPTNFVPILSPFGNELIVTPRVIEILIKVISK
jgi:hypothetical protein